MSITSKINNDLIEIGEQLIMGDIDKIAKKMKLHRTVISNYLNNHKRASNAATSIKIKKIAQGIIEKREANLSNK